MPDRAGTATMNSLTATRSMVEALVGMIWAIDAARNEISSSSPLSTLDEFVDVLIRWRGEIEAAAISLEAASAARDGTASKHLRVRLLCLKRMAKAWRGCLEEQRWRRCLERCHLRSTEKRVLSLKRYAEMACREAEKRVARLPEPRVSAAEAEPAVVDDAEGTALTDFRAMSDALMAIGRERDAMEDSEEYQRILKGMERLFSSA